MTRQGETQEEKRQKNAIPLVTPYLNPNKEPKNLQHEDNGPEDKESIRHRIRPMTFNIGSFFAKKKTLENYIHDADTNVVIITESNVAQSKMEQVKLQGFSKTDHCCRAAENIRGGGGGVIVLIHQIIPYTRALKFLTLPLKKGNRNFPCRTPSNTLPPKQTTKRKREKQ